MMPMKQYITCIFCALAVMLFGSAATAAGDQGTDAVLKQVQAAYASMQTFRASFTQQLFQRETGSTETRRGRILFKKPLFIRWESEKPHEELLIVNDKEIWNYLPGEELAYRYSRTLAEDSRSILQVITGQSPLDKDFEVKNLGEEKDGLLHLQLFPREPSTEMTEVQLWIDKKSSLIRRARVMDFYGNTNGIDLGKIESGVSVPESSFRFTPPPDIEVEDHIERKGPEKIPLSD